MFLTYLLTHVDFLALEKGLRDPRLTPQRKITGVLHKERLPQLKLNHVGPLYIVTTVPGRQGRQKIILKKMPNK